MKEAQRLWRVQPKQMKKFCLTDPFNPQHELSGVICKRDGSYGGSLVITHINGHKLDHQGTHVFGCPKLLYPYSDFETNTYGGRDIESVLDTEVRSFTFTTKYNGCNILFFMYEFNGKQFISAKTKGSPVVKNSPFGAFFDLTIKALGFGSLPSSTDLLEHPLLAPVASGAFQSMCFELCGREEPHLVNYSFGIELKPLFMTRRDGVIFPHLVKGQVEMIPFNSAQQVYQMGADYQAADFKRNDTYRKEHNLTRVSYEHDYFAVEGRVLYLLNAEGAVVQRKLFKIKPPDIEEVHWGSFDLQMSGRVREAVEKCIQREKDLNKQSLCEELDMGPKEWGKYGKQVLDYAKNMVKNVKLPPRDKDHRALLVLIGVRKVGKTHFAKALRKSGRWQGGGNQPEEIKSQMTSRLLGDWSCRYILDLTNLTAKKRKVWLQHAMSLGMTRVDAVVFDEDEAVIRERIGTNRELLQQYEAGLAKGYPLSPMRKEGFTNVFYVSSQSDRVALIKLLSGKQLPPIGDDRFQKK